MVSYDEALKIARRKFFHKVEECEECKDCYVFTPKTEDEMDGDGAIVIMKEDGRALTYTGYIQTHGYKLPESIRKFDV